MVMRGTLLVVFAIGCAGTSQDAAVLVASSSDGGAHDKTHEVGPRDAGADGSQCSVSARCVGPGEFIDLTPPPSLTKEGCAARGVLSGGSADAAYPLNQWKVRYRSRDASGALGIASGLLVVPSRLGAQAPVIVYQHGTVLSREPVPSRADGEGQVAACSFATLGAAMLAPDYIGKGDSEGFHPYLHADTGASSAGDLLAATRSSILGSAVPSSVEKRSVSLEIPVLITGYSQGGHAALALHRAIEAKATALSADGTPTFVVRASASMAGPYDLSGASLEARLEDPKPYDSSIYAGYTLTSYQHIYGGMWAQLSDVFLPKYETLPAFFDAGSVQDIYKHLAARPVDMLQPRWLSAMRDTPSHPFRQALTRNELTLFVPKAKVLFVYSGADKVVSTKSALAARDAMRKAGADVTVLNVGDSLDHATGFRPSCGAARTFFAELMSSP